ncbi:MAG: hypothetical protein ABL886_12355, partial [Rhodoglobus sp.]
MTKRPVRRAAELTSLLDVLFIVVFAALLGSQGRVRGASDGGEHRRRPGDHGDAAAAAPSPADAPGQAAVDGASPAESRAAVERLVTAIQNRDVILVEVSADGYITSIRRQLN